VKPRVLFLAHRIPYPPNKGDKIRSWRILEHLAKHFAVQLGAFVDDPADFAHEAFLKSVCETATLVPLNRRAATLRSAAGFLTGEALTFPYYRDARMTAAVNEARRAGVIAEICFSSSMAPYILSKSSAPTIIDLCDADSAKWMEYASRKSWPMNAVYAREGRLLARAETRIINQCSAAFAITEEEADLLASRHGVRKSVHWFGNGVDIDFFKPGAVAPAERRFSAVFTGAMDYWANIDAILWFIAEIWPLVRAEVPGATFAIVGSNPSREIEALGGRDGVTVTGRVDDVRRYLEASDVAVAPMRIARGVQNKVLEAMASGRAIVTTPAGLEGIDASMGSEAVVAASPAAFAAEIVRLVKDRIAAKAIGAAARRRIETHYQWPAQLARLDAVLVNLIRT
jgi:sugar transferase (PEP-CTERM/EpsH1 system associated)